MLNASAGSTLGLDANQTLAVIINSQCAGTFKYDQLTGLLSGSESLKQGLAHQFIPHPCMVQMGSRASLQIELCYDDWDWTQAAGLCGMTDSDVTAVQLKIRQGSQPNAPLLPINTLALMAVLNMSTDRWTLDQEAQRIWRPLSRALLSSGTFHVGQLLAEQVLSLNEKDEIAVCLKGPSTEPLCMVKPKQHNRKYKLSLPGVRCALLFLTTLKIHTATSSNEAGGLVAQQSCKSQCALLTAAADMQQSQDVVLKLSLSSSNSPGSKASLQLHVEDNTGRQLLTTSVLQNAIRLTDCISWRSARLSCVERPLCSAFELSGFTLPLAAMSVLGIHAKSQVDVYCHGVAQQEEGHHVTLRPKRAGTYVLRIERLSKALGTLLQDHAQTSAGEYHLLQLARLHQASVHPVLNVSIVDLDGDEVQLPQLSACSLQHELDKSAPAQGWQQEGSDGSVSRPLSSFLALAKGAFSVGTRHERLPGLYSCVQDHLQYGRICIPVCIDDELLDNTSAYPTVTLNGTYNSVLFRGATQLKKAISALTSAIQIRDNPDAHFVLGITKGLQVAQCSSKPKQLPICLNISIRVGSSPAKGFTEKAVSAHLHPIKRRKRKRQSELPAVTEELPHS